MSLEIDDELLFRVATGRCQADEAAAVGNWRRQSLENEARYATIVAILNEMQRAHARRVISDPRGDWNANLTFESKAPSPASKARRLATFAAIAATMILAVSIVARTRFPHRVRSVFRAEQHITGTESVSFELPDGTVVRLAPRSRLRLHDTPGMRQVSLEGRAYFAVARNPGLPFRIRTDAGDLTVLGTRFDIEAAHRELRLIVVEGRVALHAIAGDRIEVGAGEMSRVKEGHLLPVLKVPDVGAVISWTGAFLAFQATPARDAIEEIERKYSVRIHLADSAIAGRTLTVWLKDEKLADVLQIICPVLETECAMNGRDVTMTPYRRGFQPHE